MRLSRKTDYGLILIRSLRSTYASGVYISVADVAEEFGISHTFLEKLAETLRSESYAEAKRGKGGGYRLIKNPKNISLQEIINIFEEPHLMRCLDPQQKNTCPLIGACPMHRHWKGIEKKIQREFAKITIDSL